MFASRHVSLAPSRCAQAPFCGADGFWQTGGAIFEGRLLRDFKLVTSLPLPNWPPGGDSLSIWRRKGGTPSGRELSSEELVGSAVFEVPAGSEASLDGGRQFHRLRAEAGGDEAAHAVACNEVSS